MTFVSITDINQWKFILPNLLALDKYKREYTYYIFGNTRYVVAKLKQAISKLPIEYGKVIVETIPSFYKFFNLPPRFTNHSWITPTTMDRFVIPLYTDIKKFVWLDCDTLIVSEKVFDLDNIETSNKGIAAVPAYTTLTDHIISFSKADFLLDLVNNESSSFNAGVCLIDCTKLVSNNYVDFIDEVHARSNGSYVNDEIILNLYDQEYVELPLVYNCMTHASDNIKNPYIIHFSGQKYKPWHTDVPEVGVYTKYYKLWEYYYLDLDS